MSSARSGLPVLLAASLLPAAARVPLDCSALPGWQQAGEVRSYVADTLFEYMNGNAEGYLLYEFRHMTGITCRAGEDSLLIDVSEMASPEMAWGIFSANRHPRYELKKIGMGAQVLERRATFVKGRYYVELAAEPEKDHSGVLEAFARHLEARLEGTTEPPAPLGWFPPEGLEGGSVRLVPQSVLGLRLLRRGYVATYAHGRAFLVAEETPAAAAAVLEKLKARWSNATAIEAGDEAFVGTDRMLGRMCAARKGRYLAGFAGLAEGADAAARLRELVRHIQ